MSTNNNFIIISDIRDRLSYAYDDIFGQFLEFDMSYNDSILETKDENEITIRFTNKDGVTGDLSMHNPESSEYIIVVRINGESKEISRTSSTAKFGGPIAHLYDQFIQRFISRMVRCKYKEVEEFGQTKVEEDKPEAEKPEIPTMVSATTYKKDSGFPVLKITFEDKSYYIGPFRKYCFQISDNDRFDGDLGSTRPLGPHFDDYLKNVPAIAKAEFIRMSAVTVIAEFCRGHKLMMPIKTKFTWTPDPVFHAFIKDCFKWIWPNDEWPYSL